MRGMSTSHRTFRLTRGKPEAKPGSWIPGVTAAVFVVTMLGLGIAGYDLDKVIAGFIGLVALLAGLGIAAAAVMFVIALVVRVLR